MDCRLQVDGAANEWKKKIFQRTNTHSVAETKISCNKRKALRHWEAYADKKKTSKKRRQWWWQCADVPHDDFASTAARCVILPVAEEPMRCQAGRAAAKKKRGKNTAINDCKIRRQKFRQRWCSFKRHVFVGILLFVHSYAVSNAVHRILPLRNSIDASCYFFFHCVVFKTKE